MRSKVVDLAAVRDAAVLQAREYSGDASFKGAKFTMPDMKCWLGEKEKLYRFETFAYKVLSRSDKQLERVFRTFGETREERIAEVDRILEFGDGWAEVLARHADMAQVVLGRIHVIYDRMWGRKAMEAAVAKAREQQLERARAVQVLKGGEARP